MDYQLNKSISYWGKIMLVFMMLLSLILPYAPITAKAAEDNEGINSAIELNLEQTNQGDTVYFGNNEWIVLEPDKGYIFMKEPFKSTPRYPFDFKGNKIFNPKNNDNIATALLNNIPLIARFSEEEKSAIVENQWSTGMIHDDDIDRYGNPLTYQQIKAKEDTRKVKSKIGLLSVSDWLKYSKYHAKEYGFTGFLDKPDESFWLINEYRNPVGGHTVWVVNSSYGAVAQGGRPDTQDGVRPAMYLKPSTIVTMVPEEPDDPVVEEDDPNVSAIKDFEAGTIINFAEHNWIVLNPETGQLMMENDLGEMHFDSQRYTNFHFSPTVQSSIGYYLNNTFLKSLSAESQGLIKNTTWNIGDVKWTSLDNPTTLQANEASKKVTAKVGLPNVSDWLKYSKNKNQSTGFLNNYDGMFQTLNLDSNQAPNLTYAGYFSVDKNGNFSRNNPYTNTFVRPVIYLDSNQNVEFVSSRSDEVVEHVPQAIPNQYLETITYTTKGNGWCSPFSQNDYAIDGIIPNRTHMKLSIVACGHVDSVQTKVAYDLPYEEVRSWYYHFQLLDSVSTNPNNPSAGKSKNTIAIYRKYSHAPEITTLSQPIEGILIGDKTSLRIAGRVNDYDTTDQKISQDISLFYTITGSATQKDVKFEELNILGARNFEKEVILDEALSIGNYELQVYAIDKSGLKSAVKRINFKVEEEIIPNNNPTMSLSSELTQNASLITPFNKALVKGTAEDEDGDPLTVKYSVLGVEELQEIELGLVNEGDFEHDLNIPSTLPEGIYTIDIWVEDDKEGISDIQSIQLQLDLTPPIISIDDLENGDTKFDKFMPVITVEDAITEATYDVTLNGETWDEKAITTSGEYELKVTARDEVGNETTKTVTFELNQKPTVVKEIENQTIKKFEEITFDIDDYFKDEENDSLNIILENSNESVVTTEVNTDSFTVKARKQGSSQIDVKVNDGNSDSETITFKVNVGTQIPVVTVKSDEWILLDDETDITLQGTIQDLDKEKVIVTGTLNGITKTYTVDETTGGKDVWELSWSNEEVPYGVYSNPVEFIAEDEFGGISEPVHFSEFIVKVTGEKEDYLEIVERYEQDLKVISNDWNLTDHTDLLEAYEAMMSLVTNNTFEQQIDAETKVNALSDGKVKERYQSQIVNSSLDWLIENFDKATFADYKRADVPGVTEEIVDHINELGQMYSSDKPVLIHSDVFLLAVIAGLYRDAVQEDDIVQWLEVNKFTSSLDEGTTKLTLMNAVDKGIFRALDKQPSLLTMNLLNDHFKISATPENLTAYTTYLTDKVTATEEVITRTDLEDVIESVDKTVEKLAEVFAETNNETLQAYITYVESLTNGDYKQQQREKFENLRLLNFVTNPLGQKEEDFINLGIEILPENLSDYLVNIDKYIKDQGAENITIQDIQYVVDVTDALKAYQENPTDENLKNVLDALDNINPDSKLAKDLEEELKNTIIDAINKNPGELTTDKMDEIGIEDVNPDLENEYQDALTEYVETKTPLTVEDIQKVVDAVNSVEHAKENPSTSSIKDAYEEIEKLEDGPLKDRLLAELEEIAVDYIANNPSDVTVEDLYHANIENVKPELMGDYRIYLDDVLPTLSTVTKNDIQEVIDTVNRIYSLYNVAILDPTRLNVELLEGAIDGLKEGSFKSKYEDKFPAVALVHVITYPNELQNDSLAWAGLSFVEDNLEVYQNYVPSYIEEVTKATMDKVKYQSLIDWLDTFVEVMANPSDTTIDQFLDAAKSIDQTTDVFKELVKKANIAILDKVNDDIGNVTEKELEQLGIKDVKPELLPEYQNALEEYKQDLLPESLMVEDIQNVIDAINKIIEAKSNSAPDNVKGALDTIEKLEEGSLKNRLLDELENVAIDYIANNPADVTVDDLHHANIENVIAELLDEYKIYLEDVLPTFSPVTKNDIQNVIETVNASYTLYQAALNDPTRVNVERLEVEINRLEEGLFKSKYQGYFPGIALAHVITFPTELQADSLGWAKLTFNEEHIETYQRYIPSYIEEVGKEVMDKETYQLLIEFLDAFVQVLSGPSDGTIDNFLETAKDIDQTTDVFKDLVKRVNQAILDKVNEDMESVSEKELGQLGIEKLVSENLQEYKKALKDYKGDLAPEPLTVKDIQDVINAINKVIEAESNFTLENIKSALEMISKLEEGSLKNRLLDSLENIAVVYIVNNLGDVTVEDLHRANIDNVMPELLDQYKMYLADILQTLSVVTKEEIQKVIYTVNTTYSLHQAALNDPIRLNVELLEVAIKELEEGVFKSKYQGYFPSVGLAHVITYPNDLQADSLGWAKLTFNEGYIELYQHYIPFYIEEVGTEVMNKETYQLLIEFLDSFNQVLSEPSDATIDKFLESAKDIDQTTDVFKDLVKKVSQAILDKLNDDISNVTEKELRQLGIQNILSDNLEEYQKALKDYKEDLAPESVTVKDIQDVINTINQIIETDSNPTSESIKVALDAIVELEEGTLKNRLLNTLESIAIHYIVNNPGSVAVEDLHHANIDNVKLELVSDYRIYLEDVLSSLPTATKHDIQEVINTVNRSHTLYNEALIDPTRMSIEHLKSEIERLEEGSFKVKYEDKFPGITLVHLITYPDELQNDSLAWAELSFIKENLEVYQNYVPSYIEEVTKATMDKVKYQSLIDWLDTFIAVMASPSDTTIDQFWDAAEAIDQTTDVFKQLLAEANQAILDKLNENMGNVTEKELDQIGVEDISPELLPDYQDALEEYKNDLAPETVTVEDIQDVIDAINKITEAESNPTSENVKDALDAIEKLEEGSLKDGLLQRVEDAAVENINQYPEEVTEEMLEIAGIENVAESLINDYAAHLKDYLPLTKERIQQVINVTNLYQVALLHVTDEVIQPFKVAVEDLVDSVLKTKLTTVNDVLDALLMHESSAKDLSADELQLTLESLQTHNKEYIELMSTSLVVSITTALAPSEETIGKAVQTIGELEEGQFKTRLLVKVGNAYLEYVQNNPSTVVAEDLINAGFERVNEEYIEAYQEGLSSLTDEFGVMERETIQEVIDIINGLNDDDIIRNLRNAREFKVVIEDLSNSEWKKDLLKEINRIIYRITPRPSIPPTDEEEEKEENSGDTIVVEGEKTDDGYDFIIDADDIDEVTNGNQSIIAKEKDVEITLPADSIDFAALQKELGKFGLLIRLIKIDEENYRLVVKAVTAEGEKELVNFEKHLSIFMKDAAKSKEDAVSIASKNSNPKSSVVLRKEGEQLTAVPHTFDGKDFTIRTTRAGHFVVVDDYKTFEDIQSLWNRDEVEELALRRITTGTTETTYSPHRDISRAQLAVMMARAMDLQAQDKTIFTDVKGKWYEEEVQALYEAGIIVGTSPNEFNPDNPVTRQQAASMMARALFYVDAKTPEGKALPYRDAKRVAEFAREDVSILNQLNIMTGKEDNSFDPYSSLTRAQMAKILNRTLKEINFM